jgi:hypothetical protein
MSNNDEKPAKMDQCVALDHPNLMPGWGCCQCRVYNGNQRNECKQCGHKRCDTNPANKAN